MVPYTPQHLIKYTMYIVKAPPSATPLSVLINVKEDTPYKKWELHNLSLGWIFNVENLDRIPQI